MQDPKKTETETQTQTTPEPPTYINGTIAAEEFFPAVAGVECPPQFRGTRIFIATIVDQAGQPTGAYEVMVIPAMRIPTAA